MAAVQIEACPNEIIMEIMRQASSFPDLRNLLRALPCAAGLVHRYQAEIFSTILQSIKTSRIERLAVMVMALRRRDAGRMFQTSDIIQAYFIAESAGSGIEQSGLLDSTSSDDYKCTIGDPDYVYQPNIEASGCHSAKNNAY